MFRPIPFSGKFFYDPQSTGKSTGTGTATYSSTNFSVTSSLSTENVVKGNGIYTISLLPSNPYTITFGGLPSNFTFTYPPSDSSPVVVGTVCYYPATSEARCSTGDIPVNSTPGRCTLAGAGCSGSITNLNAGFLNTLTDEPGWIQTTGADLRWDNGSFTNPIPSAATNPYVSALGSGGTPGIIFSGGKSGLTPAFGSGQANVNNWQVGLSPSTDVFTNNHNSIPTSYNFLKGTADNSQIAIVPLASFNDPVRGSHGIYKIEGDTTIDKPLNFGSGNSIFLIHGNLTIQQNVTIPVGSGATAVFSVSGNITVAPNVTRIDGLYSANGKVEITTGSNCPINIPDAALNVQGSIIANAGRSGGTFVNDRTLCGGNLLNPSVTFTERPDFILNYPSMVRSTTKTWQEVAP
jgi:hypothetical protein